MDFEEFREKLKEDLAERLFDRTGDDYEISSSSVNKLQNAGYEGISVRKEGEASNRKFFTFFHRSVLCWEFFFKKHACFDIIYVLVLNIRM